MSHVLTRSSTLDARLTWQLNGANRAPRGCQNVIGVFPNRNYRNVIRNWSGYIKLVSAITRTGGGNIIRVDGQKPWAQKTHTILDILSNDGAIGAVPFDIEV